MCLVLLAYLALAAGDIDQAETQCEESATLMREIGNPPYLSWCLEGLAGVAAARREWEHAARLCGERDGVLARMDSPLPPVYEAGYARTLSAIHEHLPSGV